MREALSERGISWGAEEESEEWLDFTVPDELVTTRVDVLPYRSRVRDAMTAHRTQISPDDPWFSLPEDLATELMRDDTFTRARSLVEAPVPEDDLFAGIAAGTRVETSP
jgi:mycothiol S-conjugate amidase